MIEGTILFHGRAEYPNIGRNRFSYAHGVSVSRVGSAIFLQPINSRGAITSGNRLVVENASVGRFVLALERAHGGFERSPALTKAAPALRNALQRIRDYPAGSNSDPNVMGDALDAIESIAAEALYLLDRLERQEN